MGYSVTVMNDSTLSDESGGGYIHTWLALTDDKGEVSYFGFTPEESLGWLNNFLGRDTEGRFETVNNLKDRPASQSKTLSLTQSQYKISAEIRTGKRTLLSYLLSPVLEALDDLGKQR